MEGKLEIVGTADFVVLNDGATEEEGATDCEEEREVVTVVVKEVEGKLEIVGTADFVVDFVGVLVFVLNGGATEEEGEVVTVVVKEVEGILEIIGTADFVVDFVGVLVFEGLLKIIVAVGEGEVVGSGEGKNETLVDGVFDGLRLRVGIADTFIIVEKNTNNNTIIIFIFSNLLIFL